MHPAGFRSLFRGRLSPLKSATILISIVALLLPGGALGLSASGPGSGGPSAAAPPSSHGVAAAAVHPASLNTTAGTFFGSTAGFANNNTLASPCGQSWYNFSYVPIYAFNESSTVCWGGAQNPSLVPLATGSLGIAYTVLTTGHTACVSEGQYVTSRIGWQISTDGGQTWGNAQYLGNQSCSDLQAIEPSFAASSNGDVYGAFVQENATNTSGVPFTTALPQGFGNRTSDQLAFVSSSDNGNTFSNATVIAAAGNAFIARPQLASFGDTVYVVYDQLNNWTNVTLPEPYPYGSYPIAVELVYSSDGGATWNGPYTLPGLNGTQGFNSFSASLNVSTTGELAVAYDTNRSCFEGFPTFCSYWGDHIVVATSSTNGTSWSAPSSVGFAGEYHCFYCAGYLNYTGTNWYDGYAYQFEFDPATAVVWSDTHPSDLYVAWDGYYGYPNIYGSTFYGSSGIFAGVSTDGGTTWANTSVAAPMPPSQSVEDYNFDPSLGVRGGTVYLSWAVENESYAFGNPLDGHFSYWTASSTDGLNWSGPTLLYLDNSVPNFYDAYDTWTGFNTATWVGPSGPVVAFSQPLEPVSSGSCVTTYPAWMGGGYDNICFYNYTTQAELTVAYPWAGPTLQLSVLEQGLPSGSWWGFTLGGLTVSTNASRVNVTNFPVGAAQLYTVGATNATAGYWSFWGPTSSGGTFVNVSAPTTIDANYTIFYGITLTVNPATISYFDFFYNDPSTGEFYEYSTFGGGFWNQFPMFPWYFPKGQVLPFDSTTVHSAVPISYYSGTGNGSSTVFSNTTSITVLGVINETLWAGAFGSYSVTFVPLGLTGASTYSFTFDGSTYLASGTSNVTVANVVTGAYSVGSIVANNSSSPGWEYFGQISGGDTIVIPAESVVDLNFTYAYVNVSAPAGIVTFQASGLAAGDFWQVTFNGSSYGSTMPWINVTTHPGTYAVSSAPVPASANGTVAYAPVGFGPSLAVTPGSSYSVRFSTAYRVDIISGAGGSVTRPGVHWLRPGSTLSSLATPQANFVFLGWTGAGAGSVTTSLPYANVTVGNGPLSESASFQALPLARFNLTFTETGLPTGTWWTVLLNGTGYSSDASSLTIAGLYPCSAGAPGQYAVVVPDAFLNGTTGTRYVPSGSPGSVCTDGTTTLALTFQTQYEVTPLATSGGTAYVVVKGVPQTSFTWVAQGSSVGIEETSGLNEQFVGWNGTGSGSYTGGQPQVQVTPTGPVVETAVFAPVYQPPPPTYNLSVKASVAFVAGTSWSLAVDGVGYSSTGSWINVSGLSGGAHTLTYAVDYSPDHLARYTPSPLTTSLTFSEDQNVTLSFATDYWVSETTGTGGALVAATNGFVASGRTVTLNATPGAGYSFAGWVGTGAGSYTGTDLPAVATVNGPITEVASFAPAASTNPSGSSSVNWGSPTILAALGVVGLLVGLGAGYVLFRRRGSRGSGGSL